jgi:LPXTG-motif cell wall-anchored protein
MPSSQVYAPVLTSQPPSQSAIAVPEATGLTDAQWLAEHSNWLLNVDKVASPLGAATAAISRDYPALVPDSYPLKPAADTAAALYNVATANMIRIDPALLQTQAAKVREIGARYSALQQAADTFRQEADQLRAQVAAQAATKATPQPTTVTPVVVQPKTGVSGTTVLIGLGALALVGGGAWWLSRRPGGIMGAITGKSAEPPPAAQENPVHRRRARRMR